MLSAESTGMRPLRCRKGRGVKVCHGDIPPWLRDHDVVSKKHTIHQSRHMVWIAPALQRTGGCGDHRTTTPSGSLLSTGVVDKR